MESFQTLHNYLQKKRQKGRLVHARFELLNGGGMVDSNFAGSMGSLAATQLQIWFLSAKLPIYLALAA